MHNIIQSTGLNTFKIRSDLLVFWGETLRSDWLKRRAPASLQESDRVDVEVIQEVGVARAAVGTLVLHQVALQRLLTGVTLLHHQQLRKKK